MRPPVASKQRWRDEHLIEGPPGGLSDSASRTERTGERRWLLLTIPGMAFAKPAPRCIVKKEIRRRAGPMPLDRGPRPRRWKARVELLLERLGIEVAEDEGGNVFADGLRSR
ncbi:hypothetical protein [Sorangium sp. So ce426]|uniref:hypothetical protein n=1 Tax=Sorangium sp. So ce426 TaxID=3133312 RepID=UPI003F5BE6D1